MILNTYKAISKKDLDGCDILFKSCCHNCHMMICQNYVLTDICCGHWGIKISFKIFYGHCHDLVDLYQLSVTSMMTDTVVIQPVLLMNKVSLYVWRVWLAGRGCLLPEHLISLSFEGSHMSWHGLIWWYWLCHWFCLCLLDFVIYSAGYWTSFFSW